MSHINELSDNLSDYFETFQNLLFRNRTMLSFMDRAPFVVPLQFLFIVTNIGLSVLWMKLSSQDSVVLGN